MPLAQHPDHAISITEPDNDVAWMNAVLSPPAVVAQSPLAPPFSPDDGLALEFDADLPPLSFSLQILRAWIAARERLPAEASGHA